MATDEVQAARPGRLTRADWALLTAVTLLAAATRLPGLDQVPPGLWRDEAGYALAAHDIRNGALQVYWGDKEPFFPYVLAAVFSVVGAGVVPLRATAAIFGVAAVALTFLLGRALFGRAAAVVAAVGMAVAFWPLDLSRIGFRAATMPFMIALAFLLFWLALGSAGRRQHWLFVGAGIALGLTPYTYLAARMAPVAILVFLLALAFVDRRRLEAARSGLLAFAVTTVAVFAPLGVFYAVNPSYFVDRVSQLSPFASANGISDTLGIVVSGLGKTFGMLVVAGDMEPRHNLPGRPVFDAVSFGVFLLGVATALTRRSRVGGLFVLVWVVVLMAPSALAVDNPHFLRTLGAAPAVFLLLGLGAQTILVAARRVPAPSALRQIGPATAIALWLVAFGGANLRDYFVVWAHSPQTAAFFEAETVAVGRLLQETPRGPSAYASAPFTPHPSIQFLAGERSAPTWIDAANGIVVPNGPTPSQGLVYVLPASADSASRLLLDAYPSAVVEAGQADTRGTPLAYRFTIPGDQPSRWPAPDQPVRAQLGDVIAVSGLSLAQSRVEPGGVAEIAVWWRPLRATERPDIAFFVHVIGADGVPVGQADVVSYPSGQWRGDELAVSWFRAPIAKDAEPGRYRLVFGAYPRSSLRRLPVTLDDGPAPTGDTVTLATITVPSLADTLPGVAIERAIGESITLASAETFGGCVTGPAPCTLTVRLGWRATTAPPDDYTVFVHLAGPDNRPIATGDSPPLNGRYPTRWWSAGERVIDDHTVTVPADAPHGEYRVLVGLYRPTDGARLPVAGLPPGEGLEIARVTLRRR